MKGKRWVWAALAAVVLVAEALAWADSGSAGNPGEGNEEEEKPWQGKLGDGTVIGEKELAEILKLHFSH